MNDPITPKFKLHGILNIIEFNTTPEFFLGLSISSLILFYRLMKLFNHKKSITQNFVVNISILIIFLAVGLVLNDHTASICSEIGSRSLFQQNIYFNYVFYPLILSESFGMHESAYYNVPEKLLCKPFFDSLLLCADPCRSGSMSSCILDLEVSASSSYYSHYDESLTLATSRNLSKIKEIRDLYDDLMHFQMKIWKDKCFAPRAKSDLPELKIAAENVDFQRRDITLFDINDPYYNHHILGEETIRSYLRRSNLGPNSPNFADFIQESKNFYRDRPSKITQKIHIMQYMRSINYRDYKIITGLDKMYKTTILESTKLDLVKKKEFFLKLFGLDGDSFLTYHNRTQSYKFRHLNEIFKQDFLLFSFVSKEGKVFLNCLDPHLKSLMTNQEERDKILGLRLLFIDLSHEIGVYSMEQVNGFVDFSDVRYKRLFYNWFQKRNMAIAEALTLDSIAYSDGRKFSADEACQFHDEASKIVNAAKEKYFKNNPNVCRVNSKQAQAFKLLKPRVIADLARRASNSND